MVNIEVKSGEPETGVDPGFSVRGGALKKIAPSGGRREKFWGISCEKSRFYAPAKVVNHIETYLVHVSIFL